MSYADQQMWNTYFQLCKEGTERETRNGKTLSMFGARMEFDLRRGFPILEGKFIHWKSVVEELLWFLRGDTCVQNLRDRGVRIWDEWELEDGTIGPGYGKQWRDFGGVDQIGQLLDSLKRNPESRRHIVSAWNPTELDQMALPPCHMMFQCYVDDDVLHMQMYQR